MGPKRVRTNRNIVAATTITNSPTMPTLSPRNNLSNLHASSFHNPIINIQLFEGNVEQVDFFINQIKQLSSLLNWSDTYTIAYTKTKLSGKALTFIIESEEIAPIQNAQELFQKLQQQFKHRSFATSFNDWENLKMLPPRVNQKSSP